MCEITKTYECALPYPSWKCVSWATWKSKDKTALLQKGVTTSGCHLGACNPVNFTLLDPEDLKWRNDQQITIYIYGQGKDPGTILYLKRITVSHKASSHQAFHSFCEEMEKLCLHLHYYQKCVSRTSRNYSSIFKKHFLLCI
jgi:hypothetical protein